MNNVIKLFIFCGVFLASYAHAETGVARSAFTSAIENKEPVSDLKTISTDVSRVYFFTELRGLNGHSITHRWEYNNKTLAEVSFQIGADRWRTWSSKNIIPSWTGTWTVSVIDEGGNIVEQNSFEYTATQPSTKTE